MCVNITHYNVFICKGLINVLMTVPLWWMLYKTPLFFHIFMSLCKKTLSLYSTAYICWRQHWKNCSVLFFLILIWTPKLRSDNFVLETMENWLISFIICSYYGSKFLKDMPFTCAVCPKDCSIPCSLFGIESAEIWAIAHSGEEGGWKWGKNLNRWCCQQLELS